MKNLLLLFLIICIAKSAFAYEMAIPVDGNGTEKGTAANPFVVSGAAVITKTITETASTEAIGANDVISSPLVGSVSGAVQAGRVTQLTTSGTGSLTGTGHTIGLLGRNIHAGSGALVLQVGAEGILQSTGGGAIGYGAIVAANMNNLSGGSTYTLLAGFSPIYDGIASPASITTLADFYSADHSAITNIPAARYSLLNLDAGKTIYSAGSITALGEASIGGVSADGSGKVVCVNASGNLGTCSSVVGAGGTCTCS